MSFKEYLQSIRLRSNTIYDLQRYAKRFLEWLEEENLTVENCTYTDLLSLLKHYRKQGFSVNNMNKHLRGIRHYYNYQKKVEKVNHNPAQNLIIKGEIIKLPGDLLTGKQLEQIYESYTPLTPVQKRNKIMISFFIYQGLTRDELNRIEPGDINLHKGTILIRKNVKLKKRILKLAANQILPLQEYLTKVRPELLKLKGQPSDKLLVPIGQTHNMKEMARDLLGELKKKHSFLKSFRQIRNSVISLWLKEKNIRETQYMAGHGNIKSTQRYVQVNLEELSEQLNKYHPLK